MKIEIPIDIPMKRVKAKDILYTYISDFLEAHNFFSIDSNCLFSAIVKTKHGYMAVRDEDYITYLGDGVWSVTESEGK